MSNTRFLLSATATFVLSGTLFSASGVAQVPIMGGGAAQAPTTTRGVAPATPAPFNRYSIPSTVSPEAAAQLAKLYALVARAPKRERPQTLEDWDRSNAQLDRIARPTSTAAAEALHVTRTEARLAGVPVIRVRPANFKPGGAILLYMHGGAFTFFSAGNSLAIPALMSTATGDEVISIDYTLAPRADWHTITDQILAVYKSVLATGVKPESIGMMGDSAGGNLSAGSVMKMREQHLPLPGALFLMSPGVDVTTGGDTASTLAAADPVLSAEASVWSRESYAPVEADRKNPIVSPVYGDYTLPFPPTFITAGTREIALSGAVREYQAIRAGGKEAVLDVYEGMPHVFMSLIPQAPETKTAIKRASDFFAAHLRGATNGS